MRKKHRINRLVSEFKVVIRKKEDDVIIFNCMGKPINNNFPKLEEYLKQIGVNNVVLKGCLEKTSPGVGMAYLGEGKSYSTRLFIYDIPFFNKKISCLEERVNVFDYINENEKIKLSKPKIVMGKENFKEFVKGDEGYFQIQDLETGDKTMFYKKKNCEKVFSEEENKFVLQAHSIGKKAHMDLRVQKNSKLDGWTLFEINEIPKKPSSFEKAKKMLKDEWDETKNVFYDGFIQAERKEEHSVDWMNKSGKIEKGKKGSSDENPGFIFELDSGVFEQGSKKECFEEYFLKGKHLKGRFIFKKVKNKEETGEEYVWITFSTNSQRPYVISERAVEKEWYPPKGKSYLPSKVAEQIPDKYKYWNKKDYKKVRDELVKSIKEEDVYIEFDKK